MLIQKHVSVNIDRRGRLTRRGFLRRTSAVAAAGGMLGWADPVTARAEELRRHGRACIVLWMQGGPSQFETFDPKPRHANGGPTQAIDTSVAGIRIAEHWPQLAQNMRDLAIIRSVTNKEGNHQRATYQLHTGYAPLQAVKYPSLGSMAARHLGAAQHTLPNFVSVGSAPATERLGGGLLGVEYDPLILAAAGERPANTAVSVAGDRFRRRLNLLDDLQEEFAAGEGKRFVADQRLLYARAARFALSPQLKAFDLVEERDEVRKAYGEHPFGQGCLLARRLVEAGVTFVEVVSRGRWDTHQSNFAKSPGLAAEIDSPFAELVRDLKTRGLLERTLVVWMGEFGRTPRINSRDGGRDHFPAAFSVAMAGGGIKGGQVVGQTSADGMRVDERPVSVPDLFCTFMHGLGIDPRHEHISPLGRPIKVVEGGNVVDELFG